MNVVLISAEGYQAGKTTIASIFSNRVFSFGNTLKAMIRPLLFNLGYNDWEIDNMLYGNDKEKDIPELGVTPRHLMQTLGTEWGRNLINEEIWIISEFSVLDACNHKGIIVFDDFRFPNEKEYCKNNVFHIHLIGRGFNNGHKSETLDKGEPDLVYKNDGTLDDLLEFGNYALSVYKRKFNL